MAPTTDRSATPKQHDRSDFAAALLIEKLAHDAYTERAPGAISRLQWAIMRCLTRGDPKEKTPTWISNFVGVTLAPVSRALHSLEARAYVTLARSVEDARQTVVALTAAGRAALEEDPLIPLAQSIARLPDEERSYLKDALQQIGVSDLVRR